MRTPAPPRRQRGFTLIELMIGVAVTGILSSVALPSFESQLQKSRRSDVLVATMTVQAAQERFRSNTAAYGNLAEIGVPALSVAKHYTLQITANDADGFELARDRQRPAGARSGVPLHEAYVDWHESGLRLRRRCHARKRGRREPEVLGTVKTAPHRSQRGLSIVELLVGVVIALFIAAAGATLLASHLRENRALLLEARLMQDVRTAADLVSRDLRRAGYWGAAIDGVWAAGASSVAVNPYAAMAPAAAASDGASFHYSRDATENNVVDSNEQFGFRLRNGAIEIQLGAGNWQALTDAGTLTITQFTITPNVQSIGLEALCETPCPPAAATCPPQQQVRSLAIEIGGRLVADAKVTRSLRGVVRLRNDAVVGACAV